MHQHIPQYGASGANQATEFQKRFLRSDSDMSAEAQRVVDGNRQQAAAFREAANNTVQRMMDRKGLTETARGAVAARTYRQNQAQQNQLMQEHIAGIERYQQGRIDYAFGARGGDAQTIANRRTAQQLVAGVTDPQTAMDMLRTAQQDGDRQLAQVIAGRAYSYGWTHVVDQWNHDGSNDRAIAALIELKQLPDTNSGAWRLQIAQEFHAEKPSILDGLREHEIDHLASDDLGGEAA